MVSINVGHGRGSLAGLTSTLFLLAGACADSGTASDAPPVVGAPVAGMFGTAGAAGAPLAGIGGTAGVGTPPPAAGTGVGTAGTGVAGGGAGIGSGGAGTGAGGSGGSAGMAAGGTGGGASGAGASGTGGGGLPPLDGPMPTLPAIAGECPQLMDGTTIMVAGHGGVAISAGPAGMNGALVFYWHGTGGSAMAASRDIPAAMRMEILSTGGIIAAFNGSDSSGAEGDCSGTAAHNIADFKAADQIAACAVRDHGIDPRRIYTTGCSAGGLQSGCMAFMRSSYLAAAAPNSGGIVSPRQWQDDGTPAIFTMHGGSSDVVIVTFSQTSATLDMAAKSHGSFVVNCNHGGGHCGAPSELKMGSWLFMKDHPWGVESPWAAGIPAGVPDYCEIY